jgi:hypothetical protein
MNQRNIIESPEIELCICGSLMRAEVAWHFSGEKRDYSIKGAGKLVVYLEKK